MSIRFFKDLKVGVSELDVGLTHTDTIFLSGSTRFTVQVSAVPTQALDAEIWGSQCDGDTGDHPRFGVNKA